MSTSLAHCSEVHVLLVIAGGKKKEQPEVEVDPDEPPPPLEIDITIDILKFATTAESIQNEA